MNENEHSQNKNHRRAALDRMIEIAHESGMYDLPATINKEHPMSTITNMLVITSTNREEAIQAAKATYKAAKAAYEVELARIYKEYPQ